MGLLFALIYKDLNYIQVMFSKSWYYLFKDQLNIVLIFKYLSK